MIAPAAFGLPLMAGGLTLCDGSGPPGLGTGVTVLATPEAFTVTWHCRDRDPWGTFSRRDDPLWQEECVELFIAAGVADPVVYHEFEISPSGVLFDALIRNPSGLRADMTAETEWDAPGLTWRTTRHQPEGDWSAELTLPWRAITGPQPLPRHWRLNFFRIKRPRTGEPAEFSAWSPPRTDPPNFHVPSCFGRLILPPC